MTFSNLLSIWQMNAELNRIHDDAEKATREYHNCQKIITNHEGERSRFSGSKETVMENIRNLKQQLAEKQVSRLPPPTP